MKRKTTFFMFALIVSVVAMAGVAFAANRVEVKVTSEPLPYHAVCDKGGGFSLEFDTDTALTAGDEITIDIDYKDPTNRVPLCKDIDIEISAGGSGGQWTGSGGNVPDTDCPVIDPTQASTALNSGVYFRIKGNAGEHRITFSVLGDANGALVVGGGVDDKIIIYFLDQSTNADYGVDGIYIDDNNNGTYDVAATLGDNTLCISLYEEGVYEWDEATVDANMDSKADKYTFIPSDPQIAHVTPATPVDLRDCEKGELDDCGQDTEIELCELDEQETCPNYRECFVLEGTFESGEDIVFEIRTNGSTDAATTQAGVYFQSIVLRGETGVSISVDWVYYNAADEVVEPADCDFDPDDAAVKAVATVAADDILALGTGDELQVCIYFEVDPDTAVAETSAQFWAHLYVEPCGAIFTGMSNGANLVDCGMSPTCMYFPYVLTGSSPWTTGLVVTNLSSGVAADMVVTFTLTDSTGDEFKYTKNDFDSKVWSFIMDDVLSDWGWAPQPGNAWLHVEANFPVDGYEFFTDGSFGAGTQPRLDAYCNGVAD